MPLQARCPCWVCATDKNSVRSVWAQIWWLQPPRIIISLLWWPFWLSRLARCLCEGLCEKYRHCLELLDITMGAVATSPHHHLALGGGGFPR